MDVEPYLGGVLYARRDFALILGSRTLFSRAGTYRQKKTGGEWVCMDGKCTEEGATYERIPYRAFYGFSASVDLTCKLGIGFFRLSYLRTRWVGEHGIAAPKHQEWLHFWFGFTMR